VLTDDRKPLGYIDVAALKQKFEAGEANPVRLYFQSFASVEEFTIKFKRNPLHPYTIITPLTPLDELEAFLGDNIFALGRAFKIPRQCIFDIFLLVTDPGRKFVLGLATSQDLEVPSYLSSRPRTFTDRKDSCSSKDEVGNQPYFFSVLVSHIQLYCIMPLLNQLYLNSHIVCSPHLCIEC
jgi:hypothetical protein